MNCSLTIALAALMISLPGFADGQIVRKKEMTAAQGTGTEVQAPAALHLKIVQNGFQLNWTLSSHDPDVVTGYEIVRSDRFSGPYDPVATAGKGISQYIDTTALPEIIYFYKVRAITEKGYSDFSNPVSGER